MTSGDGKSTPPIFRGVFAALAMAGMVAGCVPSQIRATLPMLSTEQASYAGYWYHWLPAWHRLFSLLPGAFPADCGGAPFLFQSRTQHTISVRNCSAAEGEDLDRLAAHLDDALGKVEATLGSIHVATAAYTLVPPDRLLLHSRSQWLRPRSLVFDIAVRYRRDDPGSWEIAAVRSTAHELYHLRNRALKRPIADDQRGRSEEMRAALFESCIEMQVFGSVDSRALDPRRQSEPEVADNGSEIRASMEGNLLATWKLASIAGSDQRLSSPLEVGQLEALCESIEG